MKKLKEAQLDSPSFMEWISVEVRYPPSLHAVVACVSFVDAPYDEHGYNNAQAFWTEPIILVTKCWVTCIGHLVCECGGKITHWMPLPNPPKDS